MSFRTRAFPALVSFFILSNNILTFNLFLSATTREWKESIRFPGPELYDESFEKKKKKKEN